MTTIAWDGVYLAADRMVTYGGTPMRCVTPKVRRMVAPNGRVALLGFAGMLSVQTAYTAWMEGGERPEKLTGDHQGWTVLLIDDKRRVYIRSKDSDVWTVLGDRVNWAIGSGGDYALGAMAFGASSAVAVRLASGMDNCTGFGVDMVRL